MRKTKFRFYAGLLVVALALFISTHPTSGMAAASEDSSCGTTFQVPEGTTVEPNPGGDGLRVAPPAGYVFSRNGGEPRFVAVDPDTITYLPPEMMSAVVVDCDCDGGGGGGCTESYNPNTGIIFCDRFGGCTDCKMTIKNEA